jgi:hypothetical protein
LVTLVWKSLKMRKPCELLRASWLPITRELRQIALLLLPRVLHFDLWATSRINTDLAIQRRIFGVNRETKNHRWIARYVNKAVRFETRIGRFIFGLDSISSLPIFAVYLLCFPRMVGHSVSIVHKYLPEISVWNIGCSIRIWVIID